MHALLILFFLITVEFPVGPPVKSSKYLFKVEDLLFLTYVIIFILALHVVRDFLSHNKVFLYFLPMSFYSL